MQALMIQNVITIIFTRFFLQLECSGFENLGASIFIFETGLCREGVAVAIV